MPKTGDAQHRKGSGRSGASRGRREAELDELRRFEPVSDAQVLAAVERAKRHQKREKEVSCARSLPRIWGSFIAGGRLASCVLSLTRCGRPGYCATCAATGSTCWCSRALGAGRWRRLAVRARSGSCRSLHSIASGVMPAPPPRSGAD
jgi:hypothetical protein